MTSPRWSRQGQHALGCFASARVLSVLLVLCGPCLTAPAWAQEALWPDLGSGSRTDLVELSQSSMGSRIAAQFRLLEGYTTLGGQEVSFDRWYSTRWRDTRVAWMTRFHPEWGVIWGFGTGEKGAKYRIDPSLKLGVVHHVKWGPRSEWSFKVSTVWGGWFRESTCQAQFSEVGGDIYNCRLAHTTLSAAESLRQLVIEPPADRLEWVIRYQYPFF